MVVVSGVDVVEVVALPASPGVASSDDEHAAATLAMLMEMKRRRLIVTWTV